MKQAIKALLLSAVAIFTSSAQEKKPAAHFYDFSANNLKGKSVSMKSFEGKVVLVVNVASKCGFTPQYKGLEELYKKHESKGLVILGFPCNQFGGQEPGTAEEISSFCSLNYGVTFPMFAKIEVNGDNTHPLYAFLKEALPGTLGNAIKWNFTKFLLDKKGNPVKRYGSMTKPEEIEEEIQKLLK
jgi:glutathione peroxidase